MQWQPLDRRSRKHLTDENICLTIEDCKSPLSLQIFITFGDLFCLESFEYESDFEQLPLIYCIDNAEYARCICCRQFDGDVIANSNSR